MYGTIDFAFGIPVSTSGLNSGLMIQRANTNGYTAVVSSITPCEACPNNVVSVNSSIANEVQRQRNSGADAHFVDNYGAVRSGWNTTLSDPDRVHPTDAGYAVIAKVWFDSHLKKLIKQDNSSIAAIASLLLED